MLFLLLFFISTNVFSQEKLTLEDAIKNCLANNYQINIVKKDLEISENNINKGNAGMLPTIDARSAYRYSNPQKLIEFAGNAQPPIETDGANVENISASVELNWTLFDGFAMFSNYDKLESLKDLSEIQLQIMVENKVKELINSYLNALTIQENIKISKQSLELSRDRINKINDQIEFGVINKSQLLQAQVDFNSDSSEYLKSELNFANAIRSLNYTMGIKVDKKYKLENNIKFIDLETYEEVKEKVFSKNSNINLALKSKEISILDYEIILSNFYPRVNLAGDYSYSRNTDDANFTTLISNNGPTISLNASWNLYNGNKNSIQAQNNKILQEKSELEINNIKQSIELSLISLWDSYNRQKQILELEESNSKIADENFYRAIEEFKFSRITSLELRQAQLNLVLSENKIITAKNNLKNIESQIFLLMGEMPN